MTELEQLRAESAAKDAALNATREALKGAAHFAEWAHHCEDGRADPKCDVCPAIDAARAALSLEAVKLAAESQARRDEAVAALVAEVDGLLNSDLCACLSLHKVEGVRAALAKVKP